MMPKRALLAEDDSGAGDAFENAVKTALGTK